jgi:hypothetical protein
MIAKGIGNKQVSPLVKEKCEWTEITDWILKVVHTDESPYCNVSTGFITTNILIANFLTTQLTLWELFHLLYLLLCSPAQASGLPICLKM